MNPNPKVDAYFERATEWQEEIRELRKILLSRPLTEELKWGKPFYSVEGGNVAVIWAFKSHCALGFCKGALLKDAEGILIKPGENTQAVRKIPFTSLREIVKMKSSLKAYILEAIEVEKAGLEVDYKPISEHKIPEEFQKRLDKNRALKAAFEALTPGRRRGYLLFISSAKQSTTREARVEKCTPLILDGKGLHD